MEILNTWTSKKHKLEYFHVGNIVFEIGKFRIFRQNENSYLYTFENVAINQLAGLNKEHLIALHEDKKPIEPQRSFLFERAKDNLKKALELIN